ncbi:CotD family spore coat protein [Bacillus sp. JJ722]|uniref:CotD family spore coat protein n=1 Tax=Bacillus sp. JJ722 TaxID=3122973 RepID=UPI002FFF6DF0
MSCNCSKCRERPGERDDEIITCPTQTEVRTRTQERVVKHIHPKEIIHVHRTLIKHKQEYPVHERDVYETVVEGDDSGCGKHHHENHESTRKHESHCSKKKNSFWNW